MTRIRILTPTLKPVGGVIKIFDYVGHFQALGLDPIVYSPELVSADLPIFSIEHIRPLFDSVRFEQTRALRIGRNDLAFFSWPTDYDLVAARADRTLPNRAVIHIVQNTRHGNPLWLQGYATRLLARPLSRIMVAEQVMTACEPYLNPRLPATTITEGHNWKYFERSRQGGFERPIRVGYTTWKSDIGSRVDVELTNSTDDFVFDHISETVGWSELRDLYRWCDVFLACPGPEEGFYLPGLEAMAAGAVLVTPDVGGNMQYCELGVNCIGVEFESLESYVGALRRLAKTSAHELDEIRRASKLALQRHTLEREQQELGSFIARILA